MKRYVYGMLIAIGLLLPVMNLAAPATAGATDIFKGICNGTNDTSTSAGGTDVCKDKSASDASNKQQNPVVHVIGIAINVLSFVIGFAAVVIIILSGFKMITSRGDAQGVATARSAIIYAVVGLAIAIMSATIVAVVLNNL